MRSGLRKAGVVLSFAEEGFGWGMWTMKTEDPE
jgi:hypothetical protein